MVRSPIPPTGPADIVLPSPTKSPSPKLPLSAPPDIHAASAEHPSLRFPEVRAAAAALWAVGRRIASAEHPSLWFPEVRAAAVALRAVGGLRPPPFSLWRADQDLMEWLGAFFGFQRDNVRNHREHLVLLLANAQMRLSSANFSDTLEPRIARQIRKKMLLRLPRLSPLRLRPRGRPACRSALHRHAPARLGRGCQPAFHA